MITRIVMLPIEDWKVARIIRFRFRYHLCDCEGAVVYTRPFTSTYNKDTPDVVDNCILEAIQTLYSDVQTHSTKIAWDNSYSDLQLVYAGGRPKSQLIIWMEPLLDPNDMVRLLGQTIYAYDVKLTIYLDYIGDPKNIPADISTTHGFPYNEDQLFSTVVGDIETL